MIFSLALGWAAIYTNRTCLYPLLPLIETALDISSAQAGFLSGIYFMFYVVLQIPAGFLMDRLGTKRCLVAGYVFSGTALLCIGLLGRSYSALLFFFAMQGIGDSFYYAAAQTTIATFVKPEKKALYSALLGVGMSIGVLLGLGFSHPLYAFFRGYRMPFFLLAFPTLVVAAALARFVPDVRPSGKANLADYIPIFRDADLWKIGLAIFCLMYGFWVVLNWGPTFLKAERGFVPGQAGFYSGLVAFASIPGGILWSRLSDRLGRRPVILSVLPLMALFLFCIVKAGSFAAIVASLLGFGFCTNAAIVPVAVVWVSHIANERYPGKTAVAIGFFNCVIIASAVLAPVVSGFIRDLTGSLANALLLGSAIVLTGALLAAGTRETREVVSASR